MYTRVCKSDVLQILRGLNNVNKHKQPRNKRVRTKKETKLRINTVQPEANNTSHALYYNFGDANSIILQQKHTRSCTSSCLHNTVLFNIFNVL